MIECLESTQPTIISQTSSSTMMQLANPSPQQQQLTYRRPAQWASAASPASMKLVDMLPSGASQQQASANSVNRNLNGGAAAASGSNSSSNNELIGYYFGSISRETAEWILRNHGNQLDGAYLLRSSGPNDDFVLSLMCVSTMANNSSISCQQQQQQLIQTATTNENSNKLSTNGNQQANNSAAMSQHIEVLHYKIVETEDNFVALHGQLADEKFATIDELIEKAQGVATKPRWPIQRQSLEAQILPPTYWGLSVYQVCLAFFIKAKQWGFPLLPSLFQAPGKFNLAEAGSQSISQQQQQQQQQQFQPQQQVSCNSTNISTSIKDNMAVSTLSIETMRTLIYKSLHEFQPWFHGKISREEAERRIEDQPQAAAAARDGRFLVRERDNYSYAMCICHRRATKHYRIDVLPTGELAIQDGRRFTSLMALVSHYTIMSDGLWCALTEPCARPIISVQNPPQLEPFNNPAIQQQFIPQPPVSGAAAGSRAAHIQYACPQSQAHLYCAAAAPPGSQLTSGLVMMAPPAISSQPTSNGGCATSRSGCAPSSLSSHTRDPQQPINGVTSSSLRAPIKEWLQTINAKWSQLLATRSQRHESLNSFLFGSQNPLNNHCRHNRARHHSHSHHHHHHSHHHRRSHPDKNSCSQQQQARAKGTCGCGCAQALQQRQPQQQQQLGQPRRQPPANLSLACQPASSQLFPIGAAPPANLLNPSSLLDSLPQNSGFQTGGQSFVGSPLFAVATKTRQGGATGTGGPRSQAGSGSGSCHDETLSGGCQQQQQQRLEEDEKLISPARSIAGNLNQVQQQSTYGSYQNQSDYIYGSQPSTVLVNDNNNTNKRALASSSSSSGATTTRTLPLNPNQQLASNKLASGCRADSATQQQQRQALATLSAQQQPVQNTGGLILCGQHAGPAFRYTNCQGEENDFGATCLHRSSNGRAAQQQQQHSTMPTGFNPTTTTTRRAFDDLQLQLERSGQLVGQAALGKFVQFQDGQCLRTHRDTRSIQMAYLSSQRQQQQQRAQNIQQNGAPLAHQMAPRGPAANPSCGPGAPMGQQQQQHKSAWRNGGEMLATNVVENDIDLMDCGADGQQPFSGGAAFKLDPKLIKSSSIETLCGVGGAEDGDYEPELDEDEEERMLDHVLSNCKSNAELLQACFRVQSDGAAMAAIQQQQHPNLLLDGQTVSRHADILKPIQIRPNDEGQAAAANNKLEEASNKQFCAVSMGGGGGEHKDIIREKVDFLNKKHDLDELYTALFAELDASLKAQVKLQNRCLGSFANNSTSQERRQQVEPSNQRDQNHGSDDPYQQDKLAASLSDPSELIYEFDSLTSNR